MGQTDGRTDGQECKREVDRFIDDVPHNVRAVSIILVTGVIEWSRCNI